MHPGGLDLTRRMLAKCNLRPEAIILDVGCGSGATTNYLFQAGLPFTFGVDSSIPRIRSAKTRPHPSSLTCASAVSLPFSSGSIDTLISECSLSLMPDFAGVLREFYRVLMPGGILALSDLYLKEQEKTASPAKVSSLRELMFGAMAKDELNTRLEQHGFQIISWEDHTEALKQFVAQMILSFGSIRTFGNQSEPCKDLPKIRQNACGAKLGYYLLVARKNLGLTSQSVNP